MATVQVYFRYKFWETWEGKKPGKFMTRDVVCKQPAGSVALTNQGQGCMTVLFFYLAFCQELC